MENKLQVLAAKLSKEKNDIKKILIIGCGDGTEAIYLSDWFNAEVIGIDIDPTFFKTVDNKKIILKQGNGEKLEYENDYFDLVFSYHVLEHVLNWKSFLSEINRCLKPDGLCLIGTPNRKRLLGYIGSSEGLESKIKWNLNDWKFRIIGKFRNEFGAHAGFSRNELLQMLNLYFLKVIDITNDYYCESFPDKIIILNGLIRSKINNFIFPSVYFIGLNKKHFSI